MRKAKGLAFAGEGERDRRAGRPSSSPPSPHTRCVTQARFTTSESHPLCVFIVRQYEEKSETEGKQEKGTGRLGWTAKDLDGSAAKD